MLFALDFFFRWAIAEPQTSKKKKKKKSEIVDSIVNSVNLDSYPVL